MDTHIKFSNFKIFQNDDHKYMYCVNDSKIFEIDDRTLALLNEEGKTYEEIEKDLSSLFSKEELDELINSMREFGIIENKDDNIENNYDINTDNLSAIILLVAQDCNLRCSYCYADEGKYNDCGRMDITTAKRAVDFLIDKSDSEQLGVCFFGGEPLLNFVLIKEIVSYCHEKEINKKFNFSMTSNGTLLNKEIEEFIIENKIAIQISIDGDKNTHDSNRYFSGKVGSFDTVLRKTKSLREKGLLSARGTITTKELDLVHTYDFLNSTGFNRVVLSPAFNLLNDEEYDAVADAHINLYSNFENRIKEKKIDEVKNNVMVMETLSYIHNSGIRTTACGAGKNMYAIDINGDIYPCQRFVGSKKAILGNIFKDDDKQKEFAEKTKIYNFDKCSSCWTRNLCVGGCVHTNFSLTDNMNLPYEPFCEYKRKTTAEAINIYLRLSDEEIDELFKEQKELPCIK
ncbi:radical SAM protein [Clostridium sp. D46t1_190503_E9]|uniref:PapB family radical SAM/SPASM ranthipeptide maturase n=1 Tax=Clostridium sp. D46t1_190503_E9 TaxID=2787137 RepID=UPI0018973365|nr:radical SAM protein [Clostridium sp. D46t1_190503_E9]